MSVNYRHRQAMDYIDEAKVHLDNGDIEMARRLFILAHKQEGLAYALSMTEPSHTILRNSMNAIAVTIDDLTQKIDAARADRGDNA